jgi:hypothetical protein
MQKVIIKAVMIKKSTKMTIIMKMILQVRKEQMVNKTMKITTMKSTV